MAYKLGRFVGVIRLADGASIPECENNTDWIEYKEWLAQGNTPAPAQTPEEIAADAARKAKEAALANILRENLPSYSKVQAEVDNIRSIAEVRAFLKKLTSVIYVQVKNDNV